MSAPIRLCVPGARTVVLLALPLVWTEGLQWTVAALVRLLGIEYEWKRIATAVQIRYPVILVNSSWEEHMGLCNELRQLQL